MSEMVEMVIKIPKDTLDVVNSFGLWRTQRFIQDMVSHALAHGVVLPKEHGDLIDVNRRITVPIYDEQYEEWSEKTLTVLEALNRWSNEGVTVKDVIILADKAESWESE